MMITHGAARVETMLAESAATAIAHPRDLTILNSKKKKKKEFAEMRI
jgi:hypothetical protein